jgi:hypothetical protein
LGRNFFNGLRLKNLSLCAYAEGFAVRTFLMAKKYQKSQRQPRRAPVRKKAFPSGGLRRVACIFFKNKRKTVATSRRFLREGFAVFATQKSYCPRCARLVVFPRHTLVLASHGENLVFQLDFYHRIAQA